MLTYKGYNGHVEFDADAMIFHGEVLGIRDVITFQGTSVKEIEKAFRDSVDDYLEFCAERGEEPDKEYTGKFVVRFSPELHRTVAFAAKGAGKSLNAWLEDKVQHLVSVRPKVVAHAVRSDKSASTSAARSAKTGRFSTKDSGPARKQVLRKER